MNLKNAAEKFLSDYEFKKQAEEKVVELSRQVQASEVDLMTHLREKYGDELPSRVILNFPDQHVELNFNEEGELTEVLYPQVIDLCGY